MARTLILGITIAIAASTTASAQDFDEGISGEEIVIESPELFSLELRGGVYIPDDGTGAFDVVFDSDLGPMLALELDVIVFRVEDVGWIGVGIGIGWANFKGFTLDDAGMPTQEEASLTLIPFPGLAVIRIDALARLLDIPLVFTGKLGADFVLWMGEGGEAGDVSNVSYGLRWAAQVALELDWFERRAARSLDDEWGINHSYLFFELYGSTASGPMDVGTAFAWSTGLALTF
jgi:hypothetical protein